MGHPVESRLKKFFKASFKAFLLKLRRGKQEEVSFEIRNSNGLSLDRFYTAESSSLDPRTYSENYESEFSRNF